MISSGLFSSNDLDEKAYPNRVGGFPLRCRQEVVSHRFRAVALYLKDAGGPFGVRLLHTQMGFSAADIALPAPAMSVDTRTLLC